MVRIAVIGAGPAGSHTAECLAASGHEVHLFEEHRIIGAPVQCTGIVSSCITDHITVPKSCIQATINQARIQGPTKTVKVSFRRPNLVLDRKRFDIYLSERAASKGAIIHVGHRLVALEGKACIFRYRQRDVRVSFDYIVGADGPLSTVAKAAGMHRKPSYWLGMQAICDLPNDGIVTFLPHISTIGWIVPEGPNRARIGCMGDRGVKKEFHALLSMVLGQSPQKNIAIQAGLIPKYSPSATLEKDRRIFLVGDAAGQVKATTGGGIIPGIRAAKILASCIDKQKPYTQAVNAGIRRDLLSHLIMRKILDRFDSRAYDSLIQSFNRPKMRKILGSIEREHSFRLAIRTLLADPRLIRFVRYLI